MRKIFSVVFLLSCFNIALSVRFYTADDGLCITECAKNGESYNWCYTDSGWGYCSTEKNVDSEGRTCRNDYPCGKYGYKYSWCYVDSNDNWGYCGTQGENLKVVASNGYYCIDKCQYYIYGKYCWCNTAKGDWDYCSPKEGYDYTGKQCRPGHYCDKHGYNYYWCYVDSNNNWGYCSIDGDSKYLTEKGYYCATECEMNGEDYFWCGHHGGWGYCSRTENSDSHGRACRADHDCAKHDGTLYTWCKRNTDGDWDFCGHLSADCSYSLEKALQDVQVQQGERVCEVNDLANHIHTEWLAEANNGINHNINNNIRRDVMRAISMWNLNGIAASTQAGTLFVHGSVRVDMQGMVNRNGVRFANIQIQHNIRRVPGQSTTFVVIQLQAGVDFPIRYIRRALQLSLERHENIILQRNRLFLTKRLIEKDN